ncbi:hypothetical protein [Massilicoli timonensis]|uniref:hypothetical protein n=1 Tax=Massilicoli timonensis TaxID=2015901 RepID=UPI000C835F6E|nr:hypothetical protein [Massilicoli timonensis]
MGDLMLSNKAFSKRCLFEKTMLLQWIEPCDDTIKAFINSTLLQRRLYWGLPIIKGSALLLYTYDL